MESILFRKKAVLTSIVVIIMLFSATAIVPNISSSSTIELLEKSKKNKNSDENYIITELLENINSKKNNNYFNIDNYFIDDELKKYFESLIVTIFNYAQSNDINVLDLVRTIRSEFKEIFGYFEKIAIGEKMPYELNRKTQNFLSTIQDHMEINTNQEDYWDLYEDAMDLYDGHLKIFGIIDRDVFNKWPKLWRGDNFNKWWDEGVEYLWNDYDRLFDSQFEITNRDYGIAFLFLIMVGYIFSWSGLKEERTEFYAIGTLAFSVSSIVGIVLLAYELLTLSYFSAGIILRLTLRTLGDVDIILNIVNETVNKTRGIEGCLIEVLNTDAEKELGVNYSDGDFTYTLVPSGNNESWYTLHDRPIIEKWVKPITPPGNWEITILEADGYVLPDDPIEVYIENGDSYCDRVVLTPQNNT